MYENPTVCSLLVDEDSLRLWLCNLKTKAQKTITLGVASVRTVDLLTHTFPNKRVQHPLFPLFCTNTLLQSLSYLLCVCAAAAFILPPSSAIP